MGVAHGGKRSSVAETSPSGMLILCGSPVVHLKKGRRGIAWNHSPVWPLRDGGYSMLLSPRGEERCCRAERHPPGTQPASPPLLDASFLPAFLT